MARAKKLSLLSVEALFKLRDDVAAALSQKAEALKKELRSLGEDYHRALAQESTDTARRMGQ